MIGKCSIDVPEVGMKKMKNKIFKENERLDMLLERNEK